MTLGPVAFAALAWGSLAVVLFVFVYELATVVRDLSAGDS